MKESVFIVASIETVGVFGKITGKIFGFDTMKGTGELCLGVLDEPKYTRQPRFEDFLIAAGDLNVHVGFLQVAQRSASIGLYKRARLHGCFDEYFGVVGGFRRNPLFRVSYPSYPYTCDV